MKTYLRNVLILGLLFFATSVLTAEAATFNDNFSSGINPDHWSITPGAYTIDGTQGDIRMSKPGGPGAWGQVFFNHDVYGDFDISVDYRDAVLAGCQNQIQLNLVFGGQYVANRRENWCESRYSVWLDPPWSTVGVMGTTDTSGTLRVTRVGSTVTVYANATQIYQEVFNTLPVTDLWLSLQNNGTNDALSVTFDNFSITADSIDGVCTPPPSGMVSWWGGDNNALDMVGDNNGILVNGATYAAGKVGQAFSFDGENDYVQKVTPTGLPVGSAPRSIDLWFKTPRNLSSSTESALVQYGTPSGSNMFGLITSGNCPGKLYFYGNSNDLCGTTSIQPDTWYHGAVTYDGSTLKLYLNGQLENSAGKSLNTVLNADGLTIGLRPGSTPWQGLIDEVEIFNRALSTDEIAAIYNAGSAGKCRSCTPPPPDMVSWWDGEGDANDFAGTNHGTLQNGTTFAAGKVGQAFSFDGTNDYVTVTDSPQFNIGAGDFSLTLWANYSAVRSGGAGSLPNVFLGQDEGGGTTDKWVFYSTDTGLWFHINGPASSLIGPATFTPQTDRWYQLTLTRSGSVYTFYADGVKIGEIADSTAIPDVSAPLTIGQAEGLGYFNGLMDEITVFNRALAASEIAAIYNAGSAGQCTQPAEQYTLTATRTGSGTGTVTASGITCGTDCSEAYSEGTVVTLTATPSAGSIFAGWSGDPDCLDGTVTMNADKTCTAIFNLAPDLSGSWTWIRKSGPDRRGMYKLSGSLSLSNTGAVPANNAVVNVYLSDNSTYEPGDTLIASLNYGSLKGKITKGKSFNLTTKKNPSGKYVIGVIDPSNIVKESNETNNSVFRLFP